MGGENEITAPAPKAAPATGAVKNGSLRSHTSGGEQHFHDDANGLKAVVPVSKWFKVGEEIRDLRRSSFDWLDIHNEVLITFQMGTTLAPDNVTEVYDIVWTIKKVMIGPTLKAMAGILTR